MGVGASFSKAVGVRSTSPELHPGQRSRTVAVTDLPWSKDQVFCQHIATYEDVSTSLTLHVDVTAAVRTTGVLSGVESDSEVGVLDRLAACPKPAVGDVVRRCEAKLELQAIEFSQKAYRHRRRLGQS